MVLAGPTAVGKTDLAIRIAQHLQTEIVGADAFQLYDGLDILTGKPLPPQLMAVPHHLIGSLPLTEPCDAQKYAILAGRKIAALNQAGIVPLVVGGTGFYLQALEGTLPQLPHADLSLRAELYRLSTQDLLRDLETLDPLASKRIDRHNRRRIIRALEVCILSGKPFSGFLNNSEQVAPLARVALERPRAFLNERIDRRVDEMFDRGVVAEVAAVKAIGPTASQAIGFQPIRSLLAGAIDDSTCRKMIKQQTRNYAKRQLTWFRHHSYEIIPADLGDAQAIEILRQFLAENLTSQGAREIFGL
jgi:tRNA dimethylallyltransferase